MVRQTRTSTAGVRRTASAVPVTSPVQSTPKRRRRVVRSPTPEEEDEGERSDTSVLTVITTATTSTVASKAPSSKRAVSAKTRASTARQSTRRSTRTNTVPPPPMAKLTPAPSDISPSATPAPPDRATPAVQKEREEDRSSDKENQAPLLIPPTLLGSVKKGTQQLTPPPEYISPRKPDIAKLAQTSEISDEPRKRIVITQLVLHNFKSYAGTQVIGPFHTVAHCR
jgi:structural maintenance of chromosome 4